MCSILSCQNLYYSSGQPVPRPRLNKAHGWCLLAASSLTLIHVLCLHPLGCLRSQNPSCQTLGRTGKSHRPLSHKVHIASVLVFYLNQGGIFKEDECPTWDSCCSAFSAQGLDSTEQQSMWMSEHHTEARGVWR